MVHYRIYECMTGKGWRVDKYSKDNDLLEKKYFLNKRKAQLYLKKVRSKN